MRNYHHQQFDSRMRTNDYFSKRNALLASQKHEQTIQGLKKYEQQLREKQERSASRNIQESRLAQSKHNCQTQLKPKSRQQHDHHYKDKLKQKTTGFSYSSLQKKQNLMESQNNPFTEYWKNSSSKKEKIKKNKTKKLKNTLQISDRSMTPTNFHYYEDIGEEVSYLSHRNHQIQEKKKSVTFVDEPIPLNDKKKRRALVAKEEELKAKRRANTTFSNYENMNKYKGRNERRKLKIEQINNKWERSSSKKQKTSCSSLKKKSPYGALR